MRVYTKWGKPQTIYMYVKITKEKEKKKEGRGIEEEKRSVPHNLRILSKLL